MHQSTTITIIRPDDPVCCHMGGTSHNIPIIGIGADEPWACDVSIAVNKELLTPAQQKAWLTNLARQVQLLAASIPDPDEPVPFVPAVMPSAEATR